MWGARWLPPSAPDIENWLQQPGDSWLSPDYLLSSSWLGPDYPTHICLTSIIAFFVKHQTSEFLINLKIFYRWARSRYFRERNKNNSPTWLGKDMKYLVLLTLKESCFVSAGRQDRNGWCLEPRMINNNGKNYNFIFGHKMIFICQNLKNNICLAIFFIYIKKMNSLCFKLKVSCLTKNPSIPK